MTDPSWQSAISGRDGDVRLTLRVQPGARRSALVGIYGDRLKVAVKAPPVDGKANAELVRLIASLVGLPRKAVTLSSGQAARDKRVTIDATVAGVHDAIAEAFDRLGG